MPSPPKLSVAKERRASCREGTTEPNPLRVAVATGVSDARHFSAVRIDIDCVHRTETGEATLSDRGPGAKHRLVAKAAKLIDLGLFDGGENLDVEPLSL